MSVREGLNWHNYSREVIIPLLGEWQSNTIPQGTYLCVRASHELTGELVSLSLGSYTDVIEVLLGPLAIIHVSHISCKSATRDSHGLSSLFRYTNCGLVLSMAWKGGLLWPVRSTSVCAS